MGFITPALLGGAALVAVPIVLHLIMRREAKQIAFPALRFVERRRTLNQHRLRLRHLLLLALRCAIIALLALALARPTLRGAAATGNDDRPIATVLVFDNSLRMQYQFENQSRLERAKEMAVWLLGQLSSDSLVTVIDRAGRQRGQDLDRDAAELRVERLEVSTTVRPPDEPLRDAADWLQQHDEYRGEIYVFTDLSEEAWSDELLAGFARRLDELPGTNVYLIDVGAERPQNLALDELRLSSQQIGQGGLLQIDAQLLRTGAPTEADGAENVAAGGGIGDEVVIELHVGAEAGEAEKRGQQVVQTAPNAPAPVEFSLAGLELGTHQGYLRIVGGDALPVDDVRYFTVEVQPPAKLLLLGESADDTLFLREALAPTVAAGNVPSKYECQLGRFSDLGQTGQAVFGESELGEFDAVCLVDPPPLPDAAWQTLRAYVESGGGLGVFLGRNARRDEMNAAAPQQLLPAKLRWQSQEETYLRPVAVEHPALAALRDLVDLAPWSEFPVFKFWDLEAGTENAYVVATFANGKPALVERHLGAGRVLLMTTSVSDPAYDDPWNILPTGPDPWPFLVLAGSIADFLAGAGDEQLNYLPGQTVVLRLAAEEQVTRYVVLMPDGARVPTTAPGLQDISIAATEALGNYRVQAGGQQGPLDRGFSINCGIEVSRLARTSPERIAAALGEDRVRAARTRQEIEVRVSQGRVGRELFPALILAVAIVLGAEQLLANRFYGKSRATQGISGRGSKVASGALVLDS